jgi:hypothetical protein
MLWVKCCHRETKGSGQVECVGLSPLDKAMTPEEEYTNVRSDYYNRINNLHCARRADISAGYNLKGEATAWTHRVTVVDFTGCTSVKKMK